MRATLLEHHQLFPREITRNGGRDKYRVIAADKNALHRALRPKTCKLIKGSSISRVVEAKLLPAHGDGTAVR